MRKKCTFLLAICLVILNVGFSQQIQIDLTKEYQTIAGFGGFGGKTMFWNPGPYVDANYLNQTMDNMGSTIFRTQIYWDLEPVNDNNDPNVLDESKLNFSPTSNNGRQFDFLKAVHAKGGKIIASVWTPPTWMKDFSDRTTIPDECYNCWNCPKPWTYPIPENRKMCGGVLKPEFYEEYAEYLVAYVKIIKKQTGIDIYGLSIQNEAMFANPFEANVMKPVPYKEVLKIVGARFQKEGLSTLFFGPEHMAEWSWGMNKEYVNQLFTQSTVGKDYLDMFAVHGYLDGVANDFGTATGYSTLYNEITVKHGVPLWMTETGNGVPNTFAEGMKWARTMYLALKFGHISGWVFWAFESNVYANGVLTHAGNSMKMYYKHIKPGFVNVDATVSDANILVSAYKKNKSIVVVAVNNSTSAKTVQLSTGTTALPSSFKVYRYSANETGNLVATVTNNNFSLPANSVTTMVYEDLNPTAVVAEENFSETLKVFPTEVINNEINVQYTGKSALSAASLLSLDGRVVKDFNINPSDKDLLLSTNGVEKGVYVLKIDTQNSVKSQKIVIQ